MSQPYFSIVVPTRLRDKTLPFTLNTCLNQDFDDYEIVVADNASLPETRRIVEGFQSGKIRYLRSDVALPMTANWNRALAAARGEWILFLGDDDGLFTWSLKSLKILTEKFDVPAIRWDIAVYTWPCVAVQDQKNRLQLPLKRQWSLVEAKSRLEQMLSRPSVAPIPLPYHGLIHRGLIDKALATGPLFDGPCPDTFAGVLLTTLSGKFLESNIPMTMAGVSGKSNGLQGVIEDGSGETYQDFVRLNREAGISFHPSLPAMPTMEVIILDGLLRTRDRLGILDSCWQLTPEKILHHCMQGVWQKGAVRDLLLREIRQIYPQCGTGFKTRLPFSRPRRPSSVSPLGVGRNHVVLDAVKLGITDVEAACRFSSEMIDAVSEDDLPANSFDVLCRVRDRLSREGYDIGKMPSRNKFVRWTSRKIGSLQKRFGFEKRAA